MDIWSNKLCNVHEVIGMENKYCKACAHFRQHYALDRWEIFRVYCGHCTLKKVRKKLPDTKACDGFIPVPADENAFVTKEYLIHEMATWREN